MVKSVVLPASWHQEQLKDLCLYPGEYGLNSPAIPLSPDLPLYIRITDIDDDGRYLLQHRATVNYSGKQKLLQKNDLLFARTGATVGKTYLHQDTSYPTAFAGYLIRFVPNTAKIIPYFLFLYCHTAYYWNWIKIFKARSGQPGISADEYGKMLVPCPPIAEQQKIVDVLETWDKAIQLTRKLIEQKELQKKYLMQQLLTGLLRLAKFTDSWKKEKIGNLGSTYNGIVGKTEKDFGHGTAKYITFLNILENTAIDIELCEKVDIREEEKQNAVKCGDLFFNSSSETPEEVGMCSALLQTMDNTYLNSFCFGFRPHDIKCLSSLYLAYWFRTNQGRALMVRLAQGSTRYNLSKESFKKSQLLLPSYEEQQEIANILTLADKEIDLLRQKLAKLEEQKKGLMQVLLTGKIRLKI